MVIKSIPDSLMITDVSITNYHRVYASTSISGVTLRRDSGVQWFKGTITLVAYGFEKVRALNGFLAGLKGRLYPFSLPLGGAYVSPDAGNYAVLNGTHSIGSKNLTLSNSTGGSGTRRISAGSVFTLPNDYKLYTLLDDMTNLSGSFEVTPALKQYHYTGEKANFANPVITALLDSNETTITHEGNGKIASATISWTEFIT